MNTKLLVEKLIRRYGTRDPFRIAKEMQYILIYSPMSGIRGFYQYIKRCHIIYINATLDAGHARFVCAHELGHSLLHKGMNRLFLDTCTHMITSRFENEADCFAVDLIYDDLDLMDYLEYSIETVAEILGISMELAQYRMESVNSRFFKSKVIGGFL